MSSANYEFNQEQNVTLKTLARWMKRTGQCLYAYGSIQAIGVLANIPVQLSLFGQSTFLNTLAVINIAFGLLMVLAHFAIGHWTVSAAASFTKVSPSPVPLRPTVWWRSE